MDESQQYWISLNDTAAYFRAFGHPIRLEILLALQAGPSSVGGLAMELESPIATVSQHLAILRQAKLVEPKVEGSYRAYTISDRRVKAFLKATIQA